MTFGFLSLMAVLSFKEYVSTKLEVQKIRLVIFIC